MHPTETGFANFGHNHNGVFRLVLQDGAKLQCPTPALVGEKLQGCWPTAVMLLKSVRSQRRSRSGVVSLRVANCSGQPLRCFDPRQLREAEYPQTRKKRRIDRHFQGLQTRRGSWFETAALNRQLNRFKEGAVAVPTEPQLCKHHYDTKARGFAVLGKCASHVFPQQKMSPVYYGVCKPDCQVCCAVEADALVSVSLLLRSKTKLAVELCRALQLGTVVAGEPYQRNARRRTCAGMTLALDSSTPTVREHVTHRVQNDEAGAGVDSYGLYTVTDVQRVAGEYYENTLHRDTDWILCKLHYDELIDKKWRKARQIIQGKAASR